MADRDRDYYDNFTKEVFETLNNLSTNDERRKFIVETYEHLYEKLRSADLTPQETAPQPPSVDLAKLRDDLSHIRGIGGQRLDEIMAVIEEHLAR